MQFSSQSGIFRLARRRQHIDLTKFLLLINKSCSRSCLRLSERGTLKTSDGPASDRRVFTDPDILILPPQEKTKEKKKEQKKRESKKRESS
jgi:hypothetical protein